jgi:hypothetical protein
MGSSAMLAEEFILDQHSDFTLTVFLQTFHGNNFDKHNPGTNLVQLIKHPLTNLKEPK